MAGSIANQFTGLPIENLIAAPLLAASEGQKSLAATTAQFITEVGMDSSGNTIKAYRKAYPKAKDKKYIKEKSNTLLQKEEIRTMVKEEIKKILQEEVIEGEDLKNLLAESKMPA